MNRVKLVIAGSYQEYRYFLQEHQLPPEDFCYVGRPEGTYGLNNQVIVLVGHYLMSPAYTRRVWDEEYRKSRNITVIIGEKICRITFGFTLINI